MTPPEVQEDLSRLDPELAAAYAATPWISLHAGSVAAIRAAGGVSAPADLPANVEVVEISADGVSGKVYRDKHAPRDAPVLMWLHGGGYVFGAPSLHAGLYLQFVLAGVTIFAPSYRLAPEHSFPAANDDALRAWNWLTGPNCLDLSSQKFALGGTSAGGGLAASTALRLRDEEQAIQPSALILNIPWLAHPPTDPTNSSFHTIKLDRIWSLANARYAHSAVYPAETEDPYGYCFVATHDSLHGLPPTIVSVAELDILRDSAVEWAGRLMRESVNGAELHVYGGAYHGSSGALPQAAVSRRQDLNQVNFLLAILARSTGGR